ncbi:hypothetical protein [Brevibacillus dissolubilis]|uniref:hypothetical protein n=1 Tax=Brevibacillus dissolubilis TaxID=1844116 RepID=UPI00111674EE|nr:hypothetical protein [Brevibacillus dissolubilis]
MQIYALYGTSGTGKSSSAITLAHQLHIDAIIDDGILVFQGRKVAGTSAKYENTKIRAVKRAIFHFDDHAQEVRSTIQELPIKRLLILGTSIRMVEKIAATLNLPSIHEYISIESIKSEQEIEAARYIRETMGKHVIPIPRVEVEKDFFQKIIASAQKILSPKKEVIGETTIVQPAFSGGRIQIYEQVLRKLVQQTCNRFTEVTKVSKVDYTFSDLPRLSLAVAVRVPLGTPIRSLVNDMQIALHDDLSFYLHIAPASVDIQIQSIEIA